MRQVLTTSPLLTRESVPKCISWEISGPEAGRFEKEGDEHSLKRSIPTSTEYRYEASIISTRETNDRPNNKKAD
jgi:hypothetical protein